MRRFVGRAAAAALAATAALGGAEAASAAAPWLAPFELATPVATSSFDTPSVATANDGRTVIAFRRRDGAIERIFVTMRSPGGGFEPAVAISNASVSSSGPKAAIDAQGNATVAWLTSGGVVNVASRAVGQPWGPAQPLTASDGTSPNLAAGANGGAAVTWYSGGAGTTQQARVAIRLPGEASFAPSVAASSTTLPYPNGSSGVYAPRVAMNAAGEVASIWARQIENPAATFRIVVETAIKAPGLPFAPATGRSSYVTGYAGTDPDVVMTPSGKALALWGYNDGVNTRLDYADRAPGGPFSGFNTLTAPPGVNAAAQKLAGNDGGSVAVSWTQSGTNAIYTSVRPNGGGFSAPKLTAGPPASGGSSAVAISNSGEAVVAWPNSAAGEYTVFSARRRENGEFGEIAEVVRGQSTAPFTSYGVPSVALDDEGNGYLAIRRDVSGGGANTTVGVGYDVGAPVITGVSAPGTATAGTAASFSATATDRMSDPAISWDFGDGGTANGGSVTHTFTGAGVYVVTARASDGAGNVSSTTRLVQVTPPVVPPPPPALDADKDGVLAPLDCNDADPKIKPGATEIRGNGVDENCDGRSDAFAKVGMSTALSSSRLANGRTRIKSLRVARLAKGDVVALTCKPKRLGCRKGATRRTTIKRGTAVSFDRYVKGMSLAPKATLTVKVTRANATARIDTYTMVRRKAPSKRRQCLAPGAKAAKAC